MSLTHDQLWRVASAGTAIIAVAKILAASLTGSAALMANAIHALADVASLILMRRGSGPAAKAAASRESYFWSHAVAILVYSLAAGVAISQGVERLRSPSPVSSQALALAVVTAALLFGAGWRIAAHAVLKDPQPAAPLWSLAQLENAAALVSGLVAVLALAGLAHGAAPALDALASIGIGLIAGFVAARSAVELKAALSSAPSDSPVAAASAASIVAPEPDPTVLVAADVAVGHLSRVGHDATAGPGAEPSLSRKQKKRRR